MPVLLQGEFAFCTDTKELFLGTQSGRIQIPVLDYAEYTPKQIDDRNYEIKSGVITQKQIDAALSGMNW